MLSFHESMETKERANTSDRHLLSGGEVSVLISKGKIYNSLNLVTYLSPFNKIFLSLPI